MNSGFQIPGRIQQQQQQQQEQHHNLMAAAADENSCTPVLLSMNQTQILQHIHNLPLTQQLFLEQQHFLPQQHHHHHHQQQSRLHHHYVTGSTGDSSAFFPVNFKLGLNEICSSNDNKVSNINQGEATFLRGSKQYEEEDPGTRHSSLKLPNCWQNQQDSAIKQTPFWEPLIGEAYENSEIVHERQQMNQKEDITNCLESKSRQLYGELEAIYKRLGTEECNQTDPSEIFPVNAHLPTGVTDHGSDASIGKEASETMKHSKRKRRKKKKNNQSSYKEIINPMTQFFENLVKRVMDHQENLHNKFNEVIERLDDERRERDEAWRNQELALFQQEAAGRAQEKALAAKREATIVSYLEKISGQRINLPSFDPIELTSTNTTDDFPGN